MLRALFKAGWAWPVGQIPGGARAYHDVTCGYLGSQSFHAPKLARAWTRYAEILRQHAKRPLAELDIWVHECGWTPVSALAAFLITGRGATLSNTEARVHDRYLAAAVEAALAMRLPAHIGSAGRRGQVHELRSFASARRAIVTTGGRLLEPVAPGAIPMSSASMDFCHTGNAIEHYPPATLRAFLRECFRILRPGGIASHVVDHRDHLHHIDRDWPYLFHLAVPDKLYPWLLGHPLLYHNRYSPDDMMALLREVGFEQLEVRRATANRAYASDAEVMASVPGVPEWASSARIRRWSQLDLRTAYAHYIYRKPADETRV